MLGSHTLGGGGRERAGERETPWWCLKETHDKGVLCLAFCSGCCFSPQPAAAPSWARESLRPSVLPIIWSSWSETQTFPSLPGACRSGSAPEQDSSCAQIRLISWEQRVLCKTADVAQTIATTAGRHCWCLPEIIFGTWCTQTKSSPCTMPQILPVK